MSKTHKDESDDVQHPGEQYSREPLLKQARICVCIHNQKPWTTVGQHVYPYCEKVKCTSIDCIEGKGIKKDIGPIRDGQMYQGERLKLLTVLSPFGFVEAKSPKQSRGLYR